MKDTVDHAFVDVGAPEHPPKRITNAATEKPTRFTDVCGNRLARPKTDIIKLKSPSSRLYSLLLRVQDDD